MGNRRHRDPLQRAARPGHGPQTRQRCWPEPLDSKSTELSACPRGADFGRVCGYRVPVGSAGLTAIALGATLAALSPAAGASGFAIIEQGVSGLGNAYAGAAAAADDPATVYFNPAGLTRLDGTQFQAAAHVIRPRADFSNGRSALSPSVGGAPLAGGDDDGGTVVAVPNLYLTHRINDRWSAGIGVNAPFGLETRYDDNWVGRYHAIESELRTINVNPSIAFKPSERLSLGLGVSAQYIDARLTNALDTPTLCGGFALPACAAPGPTGADGHVEVEGEDWSYGWNVGVLYEPTRTTRIGVAYRSSVKHTLEGDADFSGIPAALASGRQLFVDSDAKASIDLPETVSISSWQRISPKWAMMGDLSWTHWRRFDELRVEFDQGTTPDSVQPEDWENTWRVALGVNYYLDERWTLRFGAAYDESPIPSSSKRTPRIPGNNRTWLSLGASFRGAENLMFDVGYAHLFVDDTSIAAVDQLTGHRLDGEYDNSVDILSAQARWVF